MGPTSIATRITRLAKLLSGLVCLAAGACSRKPVDKACGPGLGSPVVLTKSGPHVIGGLTTDATNVYWAVFDQDLSHMATMSKIGGPSRAIASAPRGATSSATDNEYVYWTTATGAVSRAPKAGGEAQVLVGAGAPDGRQHTSRLSLDTEFIYWVNAQLRGPRSDARGQVLRVAKFGGPVKVIAADQPGVADVVVDREHVFWATVDGVMRWSKTTETIDRFVDAGVPFPETFGLALDDTYLYWTDPSSVMRKPLIGGQPETVFASKQAGMLLSGSCLYLVANSAVVRVPKSGGPETTLAKWEDPEVVTDLAVDDSGIYWAVDSRIGGSIMRLAD
jgi:hypothetical protein